MSLYCNKLKKKNDISFYTGQSYTYECITAPLQFFFYHYSTGFCIIVKLTFFFFIN